MHPFAFDDFHPEHPVLNNYKYVQIKIPTYLSIFQNLWSEETNDFLSRFIRLIAQHHGLVHTIDFLDRQLYFAQIDSVASNFDLGVTSAFVV